MGLLSQPIHGPVSQPSRYIYTYSWLMLGAPLNYSQPMTTIPHIQRAVIDLTRSRSSTPDNRPITARVGSNSTTPPELRISIPSNGKHRHDVNGKQNGQTRAENDLFSMGGIADKRSPQPPSTTDKSPAAAPPSQASSEALPPRSSPKEQSDLEKENRHSVDRLLVK